MTGREAPPKSGRALRAALALVVLVVIAGAVAYDLGLFDDFLDSADSPPPEVIVVTAMPTPTPAPTATPAPKEKWEVAHVALLEAYEVYQSAVGAERARA